MLMSFCCFESVVVNIDAFKCDNGGTSNLPQYEHRVNFTANGTGKVTFNTTQVNVNADLHATGNITWGGNVIIGNPGQDDNVTFRAEVASDLIPDVNQAYDLGSLTKRWNNLYSTNVQTENLALSSSIINGIDLLTNHIYNSSFYYNDFFRSGSFQPFLNYFRSQYFFLI